MWCFYIQGLSVPDSHFTFEEITWEQCKEWCLCNLQCIVKSGFSVLVHFDSHPWATI